MKNENTITMDVSQLAALVLIVSIFLSGTIASGILMWASTFGKVCM